MHDPDVVVFDTHLPIPVVQYKAKGQSAWAFERRRRTNPENLGEPVYAWFRPAGYDVRAFGRRIGLADFATIWHHEPEGRDSGTVCKGMGGSQLRWHNIVWAWKHRRHCTISVRPYNRVVAWWRDRCAECGHRFFWKQARMGYWDGREVFHDSCMSLRHTRSQLDDAAKALTFTANDTERWRVEQWLAYRETAVSEPGTRAESQ